ncbi:MAG: RHS repeat-associated core domain-containing protein [Verrucomicrobiae bacterium]|nr:RHS repeat-associated core domain-containing protein [Verrucomicrobiae bacterium]
MTNDDATSYTAEAFGHQRGATGAGPIGGKRCMHTGREPLSGMQGLYYYRWRVMDPNLGRFTSEDPLGFVDGVNVYAYAVARPLRLKDPSGRAATPIADQTTCQDRCGRVPCPLLRRNQCLRTCYACCIGCGDDPNCHDACIAAHVLCCMGR